jgi:CBS-domain-containing membrane protein
MDLTAVGVPVVTGPAQGWNFWPLIGIPLALFVAFRWLRLPRRTGVALTAVLGGLLIADAITAWGVLPVAGGTTLVVAGSAIAVGRLRRRHPPTV